MVFRTGRWSKNKDGGASGEDRSIVSDQILKYDFAQSLHPRYKHHGLLTRRVVLVGAIVKSSSIKVHLVDHNRIHIPCHSQVNVGIKY